MSFYVFLYLCWLYFTSFIYFSFYLIIVFLPLISALISGFFGRKLGSYGSSIFTSSCICISSFFSFILFYETGLQGSTTYIHLINWIDFEFFSISWGFLFDTLTVIMLCIITFIYCLKVARPEDHRKPRQAPARQSFELCRQISCRIE